MRWHLAPNAQGDTERGSIGASAARESKIWRPLIVVAVARYSERPDIFNDGVHCGLRFISP